MPSKALLVGGVLQYQGPPRYVGRGNNCSRRPKAVCAGSLPLVPLLLLCLGGEGAALCTPNKDWATEVLRDQLP